MLWRPRTALLLRLMHHDVLKYSPFLHMQKRISQCVIGGGAGSPGANRPKASSRQGILTWYNNNNSQQYLLSAVYYFDFDF